MKIIDCEFHYYLPELMDYLATRDEAMRYYPETKVLEVVGNGVLHLHLVVLNPCKAVVNPVDDEREVFATMAENHSQLSLSRILSLYPLAKSMP